MITSSLIVEERRLVEVSIIILIANSQSCCCFKPDIYSSDGMMTTINSDQDYIIEIIVRNLSI
jgi:hypothetical protein